MATSPGEAKVKKQVREILNSYLPFIEWNMTVPNGYGKVGIEDFTVCFCGLFIAIETKDTGKKQMEQQIGRMKNIIGSGGIYIVIWPENVQDVRLLLDGILRKYHARSQ